MSKLNDYLHLIVPEYIPMAITSVLVGAVLTSKIFHGLDFVLASIAIICVVAAFNAFNAIADKEIDKINKLHRPIPAKRLTDREALLFAIIMYFLALVISILINTTFFLVILAAVIVTTAYSYPGINLKRQFVLSNFAVTIFYAVLCTLAGWALYPNEPIPLPIIFFLFLMGFSLSISKDFMDVAGDSIHGAQTFPVKIGKTESIWIIFAVLSFSYILLLLMIAQNYLSKRFYLLLLFFPITIFYVNRFSKYNQSDSHNDIFRHTILTIIILELAIVALQLS